jgi:hypothetical protein
MIPKLVLDDSMSRTMTDGHMMRYFITSSRIMAWTHSLFLSVMNVDGHPDYSASVTLVEPFLNMIVHLYTLSHRKAQFPYYTESL